MRGLIIAFVVALAMSGVAYATAKTAAQLASDQKACVNTKEALALAQRSGKRAAIKRAATATRIACSRYDQELYAAAPR